MKLKIFLFACFLFTINQSFATHNRGARIEACWIGGFTFEITITTYTRTSSITADRPSLDSVYFGDGTQAIFYRSQKINLPEDISVNTYINTHTYTGFGSYTICFQDPNRNAGVCNIPGSVGVPLSVETEIVISQFACPPCTPHSLCPPVFEFPFGKDIHSCRASYSEEKDSLSYSLVPCQVACNLPVSGYTFPPGVSINASSGELFWDHNFMTDSCDYNLAVRTDQWRNGIYFGHVIEDFSISLEASTDTFYNFLNTSSFPLTPQGYFSSSIPAGSTFNLTVDYFDTLGADLELFTEVLTQTSFTVVQSGSNATGLLSWPTTLSDAHKQPITFVFRGKPSGNDLTYLLYVTGTSNDSCTSFIGVDEINDRSPLTVYPNPTRDFLYINFVEAPLKNSKLSLINVNGKIIFKSDIRSQTMIIDVKQFASGIYILKYEDGENIFIKKVVF